MNYLSYFELSLVEIYFAVFVVFIASIIRGFNGFGFSATCISGFSFILPAIEIVPIILALEVIISIFMAPYIWNKIDWRFVFKILSGIIIGSPVGLYLLKHLNPETTHLFVCMMVIFFLEKKNRMNLLLYFQLSLVEIYFIILTVFIASIIRGFNGFGFSATCISSFSFILPSIEIVPIILALEVIISIFMAPYIWNKIDWNFVFKILIGIIIGSPIGLYLLRHLNPETIHLSVCLLIIIFSILLMKGYSNKKINNNYGKFETVKQR